MIVPRSTFIKVERGTIESYQDLLVNASHCRLTTTSDKLCFTQTQIHISAVQSATLYTMTLENFNVMNSILVMTVTGNQIRNSSYDLRSLTYTRSSAL
jgi:hypothetical protein